VERFAGQRAPHLRENVTRERVRIAWSGRFDTPALRASIARFRADLRALSPDRARGSIKRKVTSHA
ncbi:MAG TPA: cytochrome b subunit of the bc complex, partial [Casimicrobiaceae bacterium]|nr:cytochrome b subunit of the bc complex [Casimicrobiaceae bacterium]